ncbi:MAG: hypothetical protein L3K02_04975 [Thermoplasmata archaeon]|nr:hypothetical protein [Thermoplasmata archaeon]
MTFAAIGVVVIVLLALLASVQLATHPATVPAPALSLSFSQARPLADQVATGIPGGSWWAFYAFGEEARGDANWASALYPQMCLPSALHFLTSARPSVPPYGGSLAAGLSPWWLFEYTNGTDLVLAVVVVNGTAMAWATWIPTCGPVGGTANDGLPTAGLVDSPAVMATAVAYNNAFLGDHSRANASFSVQMGMGPPGSPDQGQWWWFATVTTCAPFPPAFAAYGDTQNGTYYVTDVDAATGLPYLGSSNDQASC